MKTDVNGWARVTRKRPADGNTVLVCWLNNAVMVAHRYGKKWFASIQKEDGNGLAMNLELSSAPTHWKGVPGSPRESWDGPHGDWPGWCTEVP